jgi:DNA ligase N terminus
VARRTPPAAHPAKGPGSAAKRQELLIQLFARAGAAEQELLTRLILGELRQGALEGIVVEAVAQAAEVPVAEVRRAVMLAGDLAAVTRAALTEGMAGLERFALTLLVPVKPMLAQTAQGVAEALVQWGRAAIEYKLDGASCTGAQAKRRGTRVYAHAARHHVCGAGTGRGPARCCRSRKLISHSIMPPPVHNDDVGHRLLEIVLPFQALAAAQIAIQDYPSPAIDVFATDDNS